MTVTTNTLLMLVEEAKKAPILVEYVDNLVPDENLYLRYLYILAKTLKPKLSVEYGTWKGLSALHLAEGNPEGKVISIDNLSLAHYLKIKNPLKKENARPNITYLILDCIAPNAVQNVNLLFIDGNHGVNVANEYKFWLPKMASNGIILFDDVNFGKAIRDFWKQFSPSDDSYCHKGDKIDLPMLHTWNEVGFGAVALKPFEGEKEKVCG